MQPSYLSCNYILWVFLLRRDERNSLDKELSRRLSYIRDLYSVEDVLLKDVKNECLLDNKPISINPEEGKLLQILIKLSNVKTIVEVGTLFGYSTIWLARAIENKGKIYTIEKDKYNTKVARENFDKLEDNLGKSIEILNGDANIELDELVKADIKCDMIFIDADKSNYINYLNFAEKLVKRGGLIVADNTLLSDGVYINYLPERITLTAQNVMREFNKKLSNKSKYLSIMLNTNEGLTIAIKLTD